VEVVGEAVRGVASPLEVLKVELVVLEDIPGVVREALEGVADSSAATVASTRYWTMKSELHLVLPSSSCDRFQP
jgi:hypothetical protein